MSREIRKVRELGNGSGGVTIPKEKLRDWGLVDDNGELVNGHVAFDDGNDDALKIVPVK